MSLTSYSNVKDSDKQRLAAAFVNIKDHKSAMAKVDCESATNDFAPTGKINGASFKTSISRMTRDFANLTASDKNRLAACITNIKDPNDLKLILASVDWPKAATDFKPTGKAITAASFKTSIQRILSPKDNALSGNGTSTTGRKRKAAAAGRSSSPSDTTARSKKTKAAAATGEDDNDSATRSAPEEGDTAAEEDQPQPALSSKEPSLAPSSPIKTENVDDGAHRSESEEEPQFF